MGNGVDNGSFVFNLTGLQIGDLQSYLSHLYLILATESNKFYILVDNRPWLNGLGTRPAHLWQLMVTKSRKSPFANNSARRKRKSGQEKTEKKACSNGNDYCRYSMSNSQITERWFNLVDAAILSQKRALLPKKNLNYSLQLNHEIRRTLFGLIVFEVSWNDVRGLNYLNELQTDTSLAVETKYMRRWEFDSVTQAVGSIPSWFSGTVHEQNFLRKYLLSTVEEVFYDVEEDFSDEENCLCDVAVESSTPSGVSMGCDIYPKATENNASYLHTPPPLNAPYKRRKVRKTGASSGVEVGSYWEETPKFTRGIEDSFKCGEHTIEATEKRDVLILFRFDDKDLPFKLKGIVMSELHLLTLLESGLPSWVIFVQSYPVFCHIYRPWMCPLARALYVIISIATFVIGFYDLYKNVPLLKATASGLLGPLFDWIETWEMVSRIKYLGTMLFLHNFQKAVKWFMMITCTTRSFFSVIAQPILEPVVEFSKILLPFWTICIESTETFLSFIGIFLASSGNLVCNIVEIILLPIWFILSFVWTIALSIILPLYWVCREILYTPVRVVLALARVLAFICTIAYQTLGELWSLVCSIFCITSETKVTVTTYEVSTWRSLWNDLFSKVFHAVKSILNGFVAFFAACNRHRLSIYNHVAGFFDKQSRQPCPSQYVYSQYRKNKLNAHQQAQICG